MKKPLFITFEGPDGAGKSTQIRFVKDFLTEKGFDVVMTREPGGTSISEKIRELVLDKVNEEMCFITEALLYAASRAQHVEEKIKPALMAGKVVICDRYVHSSLAYQGYGRKLGYDKVWAINAPAIDGILPDISFFVLLPSEEALSRLKGGGKELDRLEIEKVDFFDRVQTGYREIAEKSDKAVIIDASKSVEEIAKQIQIHIEKII